MGSEEQRLTGPALLRLKRFAALRAAQRVLVPSVRPPGLEPAEEEARSILSDMQALRAQVRSPGSRSAPGASPADLQRIDESLTRLASHLLRLVDSIPLPQLRATLPDLARGHPEEVAALVDLVLEGGLDAQRFGLLDYAVTLLSSEERDGHRVLTKDPGEVTPLLAGRAKGADADPECARVEQAFREATGEIERGGETAGIVQRMRAYKVEHTRHLLHPRVLAAMVAYNVALWNRFADQLESKRSLDRLAMDQFEEELDFAEPSPDSSPEPTEAPVQAPPAAAPQYSLLGSPGLGAIAEALRARVAGEERGRGGPAAIAAGADLGQLKGWEKEALGDTTNDPRALLVRAAVVIGLTRRQLPDMALVLRKLDVEPALLETGWVDEVDAEISREAQTLITQGQHELACRLLDTKTRFLYAPVSKQRREPSPSRRAATGSLPVAASTGWAFPRAAMLAVLCFALAGALLFNFIRPKTGSLALFSPIELARISPHLESAYRDGMGAGPLFMGTLGDGWLDLDGAARVEAARKIGVTLALRGVKSVMLFDGRHRLQVQYRNDALVFPRSGSSRSGSAAP